MAANRSGHRLGTADIAIIMGMIARNDRRHDIAAWFGVSQERVKDAERGKYGVFPAAPTQSLPQRGPPGVKGRCLREALTEVRAQLAKGNLMTAAKALDAALAEYDADER